MTTAVAYHADGYGPARPAIDVKLHVDGLGYWPRNLPAIKSADGTTFPAPTRMIDAAVSAAFDRVQSDFWQAAAEIAEQRGLGEIAQEGRSGGWLVLTDGRDPAHMTDDCRHDGVTIETVNCPNWLAREEWLAAYTALREWCEAYIADAPRKVRELAQQYAMDEAGSDAARRMFATFREGVTV